MNNYNLHPIWKITSSCWWYDIWSNVSVRIYEWLLLNAKWILIQLYYTLHFDEMMISSLYWTNTLSWICTVLASSMKQWSTGTQVAPLWRIKNVNCQLIFVFPFTFVSPKILLPYFTIGLARWVYHTKPELLTLSLHLSIKKVQMKKKNNVG